MSMAIDNLWSKALGGSSGGILSLLGLGTGASSGVGANGIGTGGFNSMDAAAGSAASYGMLSGGMVGIDGTLRYVHSAYFENAPRMATGGMITDGGVPIIAHPGERVLNRAQTAAYNSGAGSSVVMGDIHIYGVGGADPAVVARIDATLQAFRKNQYADTVKIVQDASNRGMRLHS
jgi:hypothetical protein